MHTECIRPNCDDQCSTETCSTYTCKHTVYFSHYGPISVNRAHLRCHNCSMQVRVKIPEHIPRVKLHKYVFVIISRINKGEIKI